MHFKNLKHLNKNNDKQIMIQENEQRESMKMYQYYYRGLTVALLSNEGYEKKPAADITYGVTELYMKTSLFITLWIILTALLTKQSFISYFCDIMQ